MKDFIRGLNVWKLALFRLSLYVFVAGATAYTTTMSELKWSRLDADQKFMVILGVAIIMSNSVIAFLDRTIERVAQGKNPIPTGTTEFIQKP